MTLNSTANRAHRWSAINTIPCLAGIRIVLRALMLARTSLGNLTLRCRPDPLKRQQLATIDGITIVISWYPRWSVPFLRLPFYIFFRNFSLLFLEVFWLPCTPRRSYSSGLIYKSHFFQAKSRGQICRYTYSRSILSLSQLPFVPQYRY